MGVDIMTGFRGSRKARRLRNVVVTLGLAVLLALGYHSVTGFPRYAASAQPGVTNLAEHAVSAQTAGRGGGDDGPAWSGLSSTAPATPPVSRSLPASASPGKADPGRHNPKHPANKRQRSLAQVAGREHPFASDRPIRKGPAPKLRGKVRPSQALEKGATGFGGCLRQYGENGQCVPQVPPSLANHVRDMKAAGLDPSAMEHRWSCTELRKYFRDGVAVRRTGVDPQKLDTNGDGRACGTGDR